MKKFALIALFAVALVAGMTESSEAACGRSRLGLFSRARSACSAVGSRVFHRSRTVFRGGCSTCQ